MHTSHLLRKICRPALPSTVLHRPPLLSMLQEALAITEAEAFRHKLLLLCAPSGYGKTTLLVDFAQQSALPCCWYLLDQSDDPINFLRLLIASLRQRFPGFGKSLEGILANRLTFETTQLLHITDLCHILNSIVEAIEAEIGEHFALILCNYHEIAHNTEINHLIDHLLTHLPPHSTLIIESRSLPPLNMSTLLARRQVIGLGSTHFRLAASEIHQLAQLQGVTPLTEAEAEYLAKTFDGWITGILIGTKLGNMQLLQMTEINEPEPVKQSSRRHKPVVPIHQQHLFSHLVDDVFGREPEVYQFLREAAVLQQMTPQLCNQLLGREDALACLTHLERHGLFVSRSSDSSQILYVCHPVLRDLLCNELHRSDAQRFHALQRRAAEMFQQAGDYDEAIYHAHQAGDDGLAAQLISDAYWLILSQGGLNTLERWLDLMPLEVIHQYPRLLVARANLDLARGEQERVLSLLDEAEHMLRKGVANAGADEESTICIEISLARSKALFFSGQYDEAQTLCRHALDRLPVDNVSLRAEAHLRLGMCANHLGEVPRAIQEFQQALQLSGRNILSRLTARLHSQLANAYHMVGNHALSEHHRTRALHSWEALQDEQGKVKNLIAMGVVLQRQGFFDTAETMFMQALQSAQGKRGFQQGEAYALVNLGDLYQDQSRYDQALVVLEDGLKLARQLHDHYLTVYSLCNLATTYLLMGDCMTAQLLLAELNSAQSPPSPQDKGQFSYYNLTRGTVLLYQHQYAEALALLSDVEHYIAQFGLKREQIQCQLRLAACHFMLHDLSAARCCLESALQIAIQLTYERLMKIELQRLPGLLQALQTQPELAMVGKAIMQAIEMPDEKGSGALLSTSPPQTEAVSTTVAQSSAPTAGASAVDLTCVGTRSRIEIHSLGEPVVLVDGQPVTRWRMARAMELCFFLLDRQEPVHKEQLIELLWPESEEEEQLDQKFRSTIYYLRKALGEACITSRSGHYAMNLQAIYSEVIYDVTTFLEHGKYAKQALAEHNDEGASEAFSKMIELYRGDYVQSFYSNWCSFRRDELRRQYIEARYQLARIAWRQELWDESATHWQHLLAIDGCMENAHYGLMRCYIRQGKRALALRQYQRCVTALQDEMGLTPGPSIQRLYQSLLTTGQKALV